MFETQARSTGTRYTGTVALVAMAVIFSPALVVLSGSFRYTSISMASVFSVLCLILAWGNWKTHSNLTIPSIQTTTTETK